MTNTTAATSRNVHLALGGLAVLGACLCLGIMGGVALGYFYNRAPAAERRLVLAAAEQLGGSVLSRGDTEWTRDALLRDPQGAVFTVSQFTPPT